MQDGCTTDPLQLAFSRHPLLAPSVGLYHCADDAELVSTTDTLISSSGADSAAETHADSAAETHADPDALPGPWCNLRFGPIVGGPSSEAHLYRCQRGWVQVPIVKGPSSEPQSQSTAPVPVRPSTAPVPVPARPSTAPSPEQTMLSGDWALAPMHPHRHPITGSFRGSSPQPSPAGPAELHRAPTSHPSSTATEADDHDADPPPGPTRGFTPSPPPTTRASPPPRPTRAPPPQASPAEADTSSTAAERHQDMAELHRRILMLECLRVASAARIIASGPEGEWATEYLHTSVLQSDDRGLLLEPQHWCSNDQ